MALLSNPVLQGLLGGGGPNAIRARAEQQAAAMTPRGGGGMMGAPSPIVVRDNSGAEFGQGLAGLGEGLAALGQARQAAKMKEAEDAAIQQYVDGIQDPEQRRKVMAMAAIPEGKKALMGALAKQMAPDAADPLKAADLVQIQTENGPQWVRAGDAIGKAPVPKGQTGDKIKLWFGDKSVDVTPGSDTQKYYLAAGYKATPTLRDGNEDPTFKNEKDLRGEFIQINKDFRGVVDQFGRVEAAVSKPTPANDIALVFSYMKMLDPTSVVREGEQATVQNAGGVPERVRAQWNRLQSGEKFTPELRQDFYESAKDLYQRKATDYRRDLVYYKDLAVRNSLDPRNVVMDIYREPQGIPSPASSSGPPLVPASSADTPESRAPGAAEAATPLSPEQTAFKNLSPARQAGALRGMSPDQWDSFLDLLGPDELGELETELKRRAQQ